jgi:hypothetical protein
VKKALASLGFSLLLSGCASHVLAASRNDCAAFGFLPGSDAFAACVERAFTGRTRRLEMSVANASPPPPAVAPMANGAPFGAPPRPSHVPPSAAGIAFYKSQTTSGMWRICTYNRMGSDYVITIGVAELCPLSVR